MKDLILMYQIKKITVFSTEDEPQP